MRDCPIRRSQVARKNKTFAALTNTSDANRHHPLIRRPRLYGRMGRKVLHLRTLRQRNNRAYNPFRIRTYEKFSCNPCRIRTYRKWGVGVILATPEFAIRHTSLPTMFKSFLFRILHTLLHLSKTQPICFHAVPRSLRKTPGCGGGKLIFPTINAFSSARSPRATPFDSRSASTYNPAVSSVAASRTLSAGAIV